MIPELTLAAVLIAGNQAPGNVSPGGGVTAPRITSGSPASYLPEAPGTPSHEGLMLIPVFVQPEPAFAPTVSPTLGGADAVSAPLGFALIFAGVAWIFAVARRGK